MTPEELAQSCVDSMKGNYANGHAVVALSTKANRAPLQKKSFPHWRMLSNQPGGVHVYYYPAREVFEALAFHGLIDPDVYFENRSKRDPDLPRTKHTPLS